MEKKIKNTKYNRYGNVSICILFQSLNLSCGERKEYWSQRVEPEGGPNPTRAGCPGHFLWGDQVEKDSL